MVHAIESGGLARCYVIAEDEGLLVVDAGSVGTAEDAADLIRGLGRMPNEIRWILGTHFHIDHIGGIGHLLRKAGEKTRVIFHPLVNAYLAGTRRMTSQKNWLSGLAPAAFHSGRYIHRWGHLHFESLSGIPLPGFRNILNLPFATERIDFPEQVDAHHLRFSFGGWQILATPGHTEESISLYHESTAELLCGDLILNFEKNGAGYLNMFCCDETMIQQTCRRLAESVGVERIYPGHGEVIGPHAQALRRVRVFHRNPG